MHIQDLLTCILQICIFQCVSTIFQFLNPLDGFNSCLGTAKKIIDYDFEYKQIKKTSNLNTERKQGELQSKVNAQRIFCMLTWSPRRIVDRNWT